MFADMRMERTGIKIISCVFFSFSHFFFIKRERNKSTKQQQLRAAHKFEVDRKAKQHHRRRFDILYISFHTLDFSHNSFSFSKWMNSVLNSAIWKNLFSKKWKMSFQFHHLLELLHFQFYLAPNMYRKMKLNMRKDTEQQQSSESDERRAEM